MAINFGGNVFGGNVNGENTNDNGNLGGSMSTSFNLAKTVQAGQRINLSKQHGSVTKYCVGMNWNSKEVNGMESDCDILIVLLGADGKVVPGNNGDANKPKSLVYYNQLEVPGVLHFGDNLTGAEGEIPCPSNSDEQIDVDFSMLESNVDQVLIIASTHSEVNGQPGQTITFGRIAAPVLTIYDNSNEMHPEPKYIFELDEQNSISSSVEVAKFYKRNGDWIYVSMSDHISDDPFGLQGVITKYGIR